jgi:hypothetical protein
LLGVGGSFLAASGAALAVMEVRDVIVKALCRDAFRASGDCLNASKTAPPATNTPTISKYFFDIRGNGFSRYVQLSLAKKVTGWQCRAMPD